MHQANFKVVLDSCVLANQSVCDLFLRLAETPKLYIPHWNEEILAEVRRTHIEKLGWPERLADSWQTAVKNYFPEAIVKGCGVFNELIKNDPKDHHVVSAAIKSHSEVIVTFNLKHFPSSALDPFGIRSEHPGEYLMTLYSIDSGLFVSKLVAIGHQRTIEPQRVLETLSKSLPHFAQFVAQELGWSI